ETECQMSEGGEADLQKHFVNCRKNPCHLKFIPIKDFYINHLPEKYQDDDLYQFIKSVADLTVRVGVQMTSPDRLEFWPLTHSPYPFYHLRNKSTLRVGSGRIYVYKYVNGLGFDGDGDECDEHGLKYGRDYKTCPCEKCQQSSNVWWEIHVDTAAHVVFDDLEARHTSCRLFFDERNSPVVNLEMGRIDTVNIMDDFCRLKYVTCDVTLGNKLFEMVQRHCEFWKKVRNKFIMKPTSNFIFIVSHPHGCHKHISFGYQVNNRTISDLNDDLVTTKLTYTASTCPGSSGAKVNCVGIPCGHVHSGTSVYGQINCSNISIYLK
ncbi:hypothetical protein BgiBS90_030974, partial [Biomphalaria glabrata]